MPISRLVIFRAIGFARGSLPCPYHSPFAAVSRPLRGSLSKSLSLQQRRCYRQPPSASAPPEGGEELKRLARAAARSSKQTELPEKLLIYHAGTARTTFLALFKLTTLFVGAFFCGVVVPTYIKSDKPIQDTVQVALCGIAPPLFVAFTTAPFVTHIHVHLPNQARASRSVLERLVRSPSGLPPTTRLTITTMSFIGKPRTTTIEARDLLHVHQRLGLVNFVRRSASADQEDARRRWYMFPSVRRFYVQQGRPGVRPRVRYEEKKKDRVEWFIWEALREKLESRARNPAT